jgi:hypothetical protein
MTRVNSEKQITDFILTPDNFEAAYEIYEEVPKAAAELTRRFWLAMQVAVRHGLNDAPGWQTVLEEESTYLRVLAPGKMDNPLCFFDLGSDRQSIFYGVRLTKNPEAAEAIGAVEHLRQKLIAKGFRRGSTSLVFRYTDHDLRSKAIRLEIATANGLARLVGEIAPQAVDFFRETLPDVEAVNKLEFK